MCPVRSTRRPRRSRDSQPLGLNLSGGPPLRNPMRPLEPLSADQVEAIHEASLTVLEEIGVEFMGAGARETFARAGAEVNCDTGLVRMPRELVMQEVVRAPRRFTLTPRNPARRMIVGEDYISFSLVAGPPSVHDAVRGRRSGNLADYEDLIRLAQSFDVIHYVGNQPTAPVELPARTRHLDCYLANLTWSDKVCHCSAIGRERALDGVDMMALSRGMTREAMIADPGILTIISVNSPRRFDEAMSDGLMAMAEWDSRW